MIELFVELWYIWLAIFVIGVIYLIRSGIKTFTGLQPTAALLAKLDPSKYKVLDNLILNHNGEALQMEYVLVSNYGVFVIETRSYRGWVMGEEEEEFWTQLIYSKREKIENTVLLTKKHIQALQSLLTTLGEINYIPIVVFTPEAELKINTKSEVIFRTDLLKTIKKYNQPTLTDQQKEAVHNTLAALSFMEEASV